MRSHLKPSVRSKSERDTLVLKYQRLPYHVVNRYRKNPLIRKFGFDDAVQVGFTRLLRAAELWEDGRVKFITYAYRAIQTGIFSEAFRQFQKKTDAFNFASRISDWRTLGRIAPGVTHTDHLEADDALQAWKQLPPRSRYVIWQVVIEKKNCREVAKRLHISYQTVHNILHKALHWLAQEIEGENPTRLQKARGYDHKKEIKYVPRTY